MADLIFAWDPRRSRATFKKHGITFAQAESVFYDEGGLLIEDQDHSADEDRFLLLGLSATLRELVVSHCYRQAGVRVERLTPLSIGASSFAHWRHRLPLSPKGARV